jgi:chemotaxis protein MotB
MCYGVSDLVEWTARSMTGARFAALLASLVSLGSITTLAEDRPPAFHASRTRSSQQDAAPARKPLGVGFIRPPSPAEALVSQITGDNQATGNRRMLGAGDQAYLDLQNPYDVEPGDHFTVYRRIKKVYHPVRGHYLGDLTVVVGVVKVLQVRGSKATVRVERSFEPMFAGDEATREAPTEPAPREPTQSPPSGAGMIIELPPGQTLIGEGSMVYVDWGRKDGVKVGDRFQIFREPMGSPPERLGEVQIVAVEDQTATARIVRSRAPILRGDRIAPTALMEQHEGLVPPSPRGNPTEPVFQDPAEPFSTILPPDSEIPEAFGGSR